MTHLISGARRLALTDMVARAQQAATGFERLGISAGDRVILYLRNDFAFFDASRALGALGAYPVPLNWHASLDEAQYIFQDSGAKAAVVHADFWALARQAAPSDLPMFAVETPPEIAAAYHVPPDLCGTPQGAASWDAFVADHPPRPVVAGDPPGAMIYTSGTTGRPKGVRRKPPSPAQFAAGLRLSAGAMGFYPQIIEGSTTPAVTVMTGPMYHSAPFGYASLAVRAGAEIHLQPRFDPEELLQMIERHRVTNLHMVPTMFVRLLRLPPEVRGRYDLTSLRSVTHGAAPCPPDVKRAMITWWGPVIEEYYGATETGAVVHCTSTEWLAHPGSVGKAQADVKLLILDDEGRPCPTGVAGEVFVRLTTGGDFTYHGDDAKRAKAERDGLITAGDIGYLDTDGFLYLCDRRNHMVISGGVNIYPAEIEHCLLAMPGVADCAVFGIPDDEFGEALCAYIQSQPGQTLTAAQVRAYAAQHLAKFKVPKVVEFLPELPREDSGKIFKRKLRDPYWAGRERRI